MASPPKQTTTAKSRIFVAEPMKSKPVTTVPGIGDVIGGSVQGAGMHTAKELYGQYLINPNGFQDFMKGHGANTKQRKDTYEAMKGWDEQNN